MNQEKLAQIEAPRNVEELEHIVPKLFEAALDQEFEEHQRRRIAHAWQYGNSLSIGGLEKLRSAIKPEWNDTLTTLATDKSELFVQKSSFFWSVACRCLTATQLCAPAFEALRTSGRASAIPDYVLRNASDREQLAALALETKELSTRCEALSLLGKSRSRADEFDHEWLAKLISETLEKMDGKSVKFPTLKHREPQRVCHFVDTPDLLRKIMIWDNSAFRVEAMRRYERIEMDLSPADRWTELLDIVTRFPAAIAESYNHSAELDVVEVTWASGKKPARHFALRRIAELLDQDHSSEDHSPRRHDRQTYVDALVRFCAEAPDLVRRYVEEERLEYYCYATLIEFKRLGDAEIDQVLIDDLVERLGYADEYYFSEDRDEDERDSRYEYEGYEADLEALIQSLLPTQLERLQADEDTRPADIARLFPYIGNAEVVLTCSPALIDLAARSKPVRTKLPMALSQVEPAVLEEAGWLGDRRKAIREVGLEALLTSSSPKAGEYLKQIYGDKKTNDADKDRIISRLDDLGLADSLPGAEFSFDSLQDKAAKAKIKPQVKKLWSSELAALFEPLDEATGLYLMTMAFESTDPKLPRTVKQALQQQSREKQAQVAEHFVHLWLASNGDSKSRWMLKFLPNFADDRIVDPLMKGFQKWFKRAKPKAVFVLETLGTLDTNYALSQVQQVRGKNTYSYALQKGAQSTLEAAAKRRGVKLLDLYDELTPDFGLSKDGLVLDVGPHNYIVSVAGDLSLRVRHSKTDKVTKSFPKIKKDEDPDLHAGADSQFKFLRSNLKKVAKQQGKRLYEAMVCERRWPQARWQTLFSDHPLLGLLGQSLIWSTTDGRTFRISEDQSLINTDDDAVALTESDEISLWHPATATSGDEIDSWARHLTDYQITPMVDQVGQPKLELSAEELNANELTRFENLEVPHVIVKRSMESWNYDFAIEDGPSINEFSRSFPLAGYGAVVGVEMDAFDYGGQTAKLGSISFYRQGVRGAIKIAEVPRAIVATVLGHGEKLRAQAVAGDG